MSIGRHPLWGVTNHLDGLLKKALAAPYLASRLLCWLLGISVLKIGAFVKNIGGQ
jgi:hypothetical protein